MSKFIFIFLFLSVTHEYLLLHFWSVRSQYFRENKDIQIVSFQFWWVQSTHYDLPVSLYSIVFYYFLPKSNLFYSLHSYFLLVLVLPLSMLDFSIPLLIHLDIYTIWGAFSPHFKLSLCKLSLIFTIFTLTNLFSPYITLSYLSSLNSTTI